MPIVHSVQEANIEAQMEKIKSQSVKPKAVEPFHDPIREFARASQVAGMARGWLTYPVEERKRLVKDALRFIPRIPGDEREGRLPEADKDFEARQMERWRTLCVIIQEESRAKPPVRSVEVAIGAFKQLFYDYDWKTKPLDTPPAKVG